MFHNQTHMIFMALEIIFTFFFARRHIDLWHHIYFIQFFWWPHRALSNKSNFSLFGWTNFQHTHCNLSLLRLKKDNGLGNPEKVRLDWRFVRQLRGNIFLSLPERRLFCLRSRGQTQTNYDLRLFSMSFPRKTFSLNFPRLWEVLQENAHWNSHSVDKSQEVHNHKRKLRSSRREKKWEDACFLEDFKRKRNRENWTRFNSLAV